MNRVTYIELAGEKYPLVFSLGAAKKITEKYGEIDKIDEVLSLEHLDSETLGAISGILEILIRQGCEYKNRFEGHLPPEMGAHTEDGKYVPLTQEEIELCIGLYDGKAIDAIAGAINASSKQELQVETKNETAPKED